MSELNEKLLEIKRQKDTYIIPQNLKKDVEVFGITGTYEGSGSGDVKLFDTVEHMQQDPNPQEGDLAVVYREELTSVTEESEFDSCIFPNTVVLDEAFSGSIYGSFRSTSSGYFDGMINVSSSNFRFNGYGDEMIRVEYTSQDGITYTRTDGGEELQEFGTTIKYEPMEPWNDVIGSFMKIGGNYFDGLFEYTTNYINKNYVDIRKLEDIEYDGSTATFKNQYLYEYSSTFLEDLITKLRAIKSNAMCYWLYVGVDEEIYSIIPDVFYEFVIPTLNGNFVFQKQTGTSGTFGFKYYKYNTNTEQFEYIKDITISNLTTISGASTSYDYYKSDNDYIVKTKSVIYRWSSYSGLVGEAISVFDNDFYTIIISNSTKLSFYKIESKYINAKLQLNAIADYVYEKTFYGKEGVENGTLTTNVSNSFVDVNAEVYTKIQEQYDSMQPRIVANQERIDTSTKCIPCKSDGTPLLDTSNVTNMKEMFYGCKNLITIPLLDTSNVTNMSDMFVNCEKLSKLHLLDTSNVTNMNNMFYRCFALKTIPLLDTSNVINMGWTFMSCGIEELPSLDTSNVTDMSRTFDGCSHLVILPQLDTSSVTSMDNAFYGCTSLSNTSLNNILAMCANSAITSTKTLNNIGLTEEQATICQSLSNYQAFVNAGWTTGY